MSGPGAATKHAMSAGHLVVFIDTNLDTHLAMIVSDADTVSDLKVKITLEHPVCFPQSGEIKVDAVKVKRRGHSYHLSDSMLVASALGGLKKNLFLSIDISKRVEHPESEALRTLLALTDKPSTDIVVGVADDQQKNPPDLVISATPPSPSKVSRGLEPMIARNHEIQPEMKTSHYALGEYSESVNATSAVLSVGKTDDTNLNVKKRRKRIRASSLVEEPPQKKHISEHMHDGTVHVDNEENGCKPDKVAEPQSFVGTLSPKAHDTSRAENPDNPLKHSDVEMNDVDAAKTNNQFPAEIAQENGILSVVSEAKNSQRKGNSISAVDNSGYANYHVSIVSESHRNDVSEAPNDLLGEQRINTNQDKMETIHGEVTDAGIAMDAEKIIEERLSPKKRKKSSNPKSTSENPPILLGGHSLVENPEVPLVGHSSLVETLKPPHGVDSDKPENSEHNISPPQVEGINVAVEDADVTSHEKQGNERESSQPNTEKAAATADNVEEKKNRNRKKRGTEGKNVHESREEIDEGKNNIPNADEKERAVSTAVNKPQEHRREAISLELREQGAVNADNGEKEKQKRRTKKRKEKNVEQAESRPKKGEKNSSHVEGNEIVINAFEKKSNEENIDESKGQHQEVVDDVKEKVDKRGKKRRSDKNVGQLTDNVQKSEINHSQTEGKAQLEIAGAADDNKHQERVDQIESVQEASELNAGPDNTEHTDKKSRKRRSTKHKEKSFVHSMHVPEKEEVDSYQMVAEKTDPAGNHEDKVEKKSRHRKRSKEMNSASQEMVDLNSSHNENMSLEKKIGENFEKMEKTRKRRSKVKNVSNQEIKGSRDYGHKENVSIEQGTGDPVEKIEKNVSNQEIKGSHDSGHKENLSIEQGTRDPVEKIEKKSKNRKSSKVKDMTAQELEGVEFSQNETLPSEKVTHGADKANDHMVEVPGSDKINFSDYFMPGEARPDVAASVTDSVDEEKNKKSQVDKTRSTIETDKLNSPLDKELSEVTGNGSEAAAVTAFRGVRSSKVVQRSAAMGNDVEVSASSTSSLNRPLNNRKAGKSRPSRDQFRVAIRKPSNNNTMVGSESKRSLLAVPGAIFKEDSSDSSKHAESDHSYSSMRTPSRKLFVDYSGSESDANEDTTDDENLSGGIGHFSNGQSGLSGEKSMTLNNILRSSSRYKKAKQAAVESQLNDSESQPLDFVPDSQANV